MHGFILFLFIVLSDGVLYELILWKDSLELEIFWHIFSFLISYFLTEMQYAIDC